MEKFFRKILGQSWKTTLVGYVLAIVLAVQPLLDVDVDFSNKWDRAKYAARLVVAALVAILGKYSADSHQVKQADAKADEAIVAAVDAKATVDSHIQESS